MAARGAAGSVSVERLTRGDEGASWRRCMPRRGERIAVEVEEDGCVEWRDALVSQRRFAVGAFLAVVCFRDGTPDELFVEEYRLDEEGGEWRRLYSEGEAA